MEDGVVGVLPALVQQAAVGLPLVLHEAVAVPVAIAVDPVQGGLDMGPEGRDERTIAGTLIVDAGQQDKQRRGIDAALIAAKGYLLQRRHLAVAGLGQDFAGSACCLGIDLRVLASRQDTRAHPGQSRP